MQNNLKISFDIHGVMDHLPDVFSFLSKIIVENGAELHVITGSPISVAEKELEKLNITYTHLFSIPDYHISIGATYIPDIIFKLFQMIFGVLNS